MTPLRSSSHSNWYLLAYERGYVQGLYTGVVIGTIASVTGALVFMSSVKRDR